MEKDSIIGSNFETWRYLYFQGSTGGQFTSYSLRMTFLQPGYSGEWIDAVRFYYEGQPIREGDWTHLSLSGVINRRNSGEMP